jgi:hypothetical protein
MASAQVAEHVDLLLVLASDVSRSVDQPKFRLQREGYAAAIADPQVLDAIKSGAHQQIAVCFVEWSGATSLKLVIDWTIVGDAASARKIGDQMLELPRSFADRTSISGGIEFAEPARARRLRIAAPTIDVSGDGTNNRDATSPRGDERSARAHQRPGHPQRRPGNRAHQPPGGSTSTTAQRGGRPGAFVSWRRTRSFGTPRQQR